MVGNVIISKYITTSILWVMCMGLAVDLVKILQGWIPIIVAIITILLTFMAEGLLLFKRYRNWVKQGIQDGKDRLTRQDLKYFFSWYGPYWAIRLIFVIWLISESAGWKVDVTIYWILAGSIPVSTLPHILLRSKNIK